MTSSCQWSRGELGWEGYEFSLGKRKWGLLVVMEMFCIVTESTPRSWWWCRMISFERHYHRRNWVKYTWEFLSVISYNCVWIYNYFTIEREMKKKRLLASSYPLVFWWDLVGSQYRLIGYLEEKREERRNEWKETEEKRGVWKHRTDGKGKEKNSNIPFKRLFYRIV